MAVKHRSSKKEQLKSGGVLSVDDARKMVQQKEVDEVKLARRVIEAAEGKARRYAKKGTEITEGQ